MAGGELELTARPVAPLTLTAGLSYIDARFTRTNPGSTITPGSKFVETPEISATAVAEYEIALRGDRVLRLSADYSYRSRTHKDPGNTPELTQGGYGLANARLTFVPGRGSWQLAIYGTNLADKRYLSAAGASVLSSIGLVEGQFGRPREWGATLQAGLR